MNYRFWLGPPLLTRSKARYYASVVPNRRALDSALKIFCISRMLAAGSPYVGAISSVDMRLDEANVEVAEVKYSSGPLLEPPTKADIALLYRNIRPKRAVLC